MSGTVHLSLRLPADLVAELVAEAKYSDRSLSFVVAKRIRATPMETMLMRGIDLIAGAVRSEYPGALSSKHPEEIADRPESSEHKSLLPHHPRCGCTICKPKG